MLSENNKIFVGMKISDRLRDDLDTAKESVKPLFNNNNPRYLQIKYIDDDDYIGKVIDSGVTFEIIENMRMNLKTMLNLICPNFVVADNAISIIALHEEKIRVVY